MEHHVAFSLGTLLLIPRTELSANVIFPHNITFGEKIENVTITNITDVLPEKLEFNQQSKGKKQEQFLHLSIFFQMTKYIDTKKNIKL